MIVTPTTTVRTNDTRSHARSPARTRLLAAQLLFLVIACSGAESPSEPPAAPRKIVSLSITPSAAALFTEDVIGVGASAKDSAGASISGVPIRWSTSDSAVAVVDATGVLRALADGNAVITASADTFRASFPVQVNASANATNIRLGSDALFPQQEEPSIVMEAAGRLFVGWKEMNLPAGLNRVAFANSSDGGAHWTTSVLMDSGTAYAVSDPWLITDNAGRLFYARVHATSGLPWIDPWRIAVSQSADAGATWTNLVLADRATPGADKPALHSDANGTMYLTYVGLTTTVNQIEVTRSLDNGLTWDARMVLPSGELCAGPAIVTGRDGLVKVAWWDRPKNNILFASFAFGQTGPVTPSQINVDEGTVPFFLVGGLVPQPAFPSMVRMPGGRLVVGWPDYTEANWDVVVRYSDDDGQTWAPMARVNDSGLNKQWLITLAAGSDGALHAAWYDARNGTTHVVYARSRDGGRTWSRNFRVTSAPTVGTPRLSEYLSMTADADGNAYLAWTDGRGVNFDVYFAKISQQPQ